MRHMIHGWLFRGLIFAGLGLLMAASGTSGEMVLVQDGQPRATIVVAKDVAEGAKQKIQTAAEELQAYVQKISGAKLADRGRYAKRPGAGDSRRPQPLERCPGRGDSRRRDCRPPRGRLRDRLPGRPAALGRQ